MDLTTLEATPSWEWPANAGATILAILRDEHAAESDRCRAADLAGDVIVINDELAKVLLGIVAGDAGSVELRSTAAISLGPALEHAYTVEFDDPDDILLSEAMVHRVQQAFRQLFADPDVPDLLRRRILEASVRDPQDWHREAIVAAQAGGERDWQLTSVFCMRFVRGFEDRILEAFESDDPEVRYQAICAAGNWSVDAAWPYVAAVAVSIGADRDLRLAAIESVAAIRPLEAAEILGNLTDSDDEEIVDAAFEALAMAEAFSGDDFDDRDDDDEDGDEDEEHRP